MRALILAAALFGLWSQTAAAQLVPKPLPMPDPARGAALIRDEACGACHTVPGIAGAVGLVGPPLTQMGRRRYIAGLLPNTPENMALWLRHPQRIVPGNVMPDMGLDEADARDITAYLERLR